MAKNFILAFVMFTLVFTGCKKDGCTDSKATNYEKKAKTDDGSCTYPNATLEIELDHFVGTEQLEFDTMKYLSAVGNKYSVKTLKYFISDIVIHREDKDISLTQDLYIDANDITTISNEMNTSLEQGNYTGITFVFGFTPENNTAGKYPNAPESNMVWPDPMGGGWHFMKLEGYYDSLATGNVKTYATHIGNTMTGQNHFTVHFDHSFTIKGETSVNIQLDMNINNWYQNPNNYDFNNYDNGIMNNQSVQTMLNQNGKTDVFSLEAILLEN